MADKAGTNKGTNSDGNTTTAKRSRKVKLIAGVVCVALAGGAYVLGSRSAAPAASGTDVPGTTTTLALIDGCAKAPEPGIPKTVIDLPEMSINLADGHYLRVAVSLGLCAEVVLATPEEFLTAPAKDIVVSTLSGLKMDDLATQAGRDQAKKTLAEQISAAYPGEVYELFFVQFVMQ